MYMIRDRLVLGIRDNALSQRLQMDSELTLEKAKRTSVLLSVLYSRYYGYVYILHVLISYHCINTSYYWVVAAWIDIA